MLKKENKRYFDRVDSLLPLLNTQNEGINEGEVLRGRLEHGKELHAKEDTWRGHTYGGTVQSKYATYTTLKGTSHGEDANH